MDSMVVPIAWTVALKVPSDEHRLRTDDEIASNASQAVIKNCPVKGVKGYSVLSPYLNMAKDIPVDYMHAVLEGVTKTLLIKFWMQRKYQNHRFIS